MQINITKHDRKEHCRICTQCDYWQRQIEIYQRRIDRHIEQVKTATANTAAFNSFAARASPQAASGTLASFGRGSQATLKFANSSRHDSIGTLGTQGKPQAKATATLNGNGTAQFNFNQKRRIS